MKIKNQLKEEELKYIKGLSKPTIKAEEMQQHQQQQQGDNSSKNMVKEVISECKTEIDDLLQ